MNESNSPQQDTRLKQKSDLIEILRKNNTSLLEQIEQQKETIEKLKTEYKNIHLLNISNYQEICKLSLS